MLKTSILAILIVVFISSDARSWTEPQAFQFNFDNQTNDSEGEDVSQTKSSGSVVQENEQIEVEIDTTPHLVKRPWSRADYSKQSGALGWSENIFAIPDGLKPRVQFWIDVYTKYSTDQGVLHDSEHVSVVYESIDFNSIMNDETLTEKQKRKARKKLVETKKKEISDRLKRLSQVTEPSSLIGEDLRYWNMFSQIDEPNKFIKALHKKRLRFQLGQSDRFLQGIYYSGQYLPMMEKIFREQGLPIELTRLPFVESSFNVKARSRVGASGVWQFMRYTGKRFMRINYAVDERNDPIRATEAAARLFKINYSMLGQWPLAITGYNHGPAGVQRVVRKFNTDDIVELVDERYGRFGFASANFYACFLAALHVEQNADKYFTDKLEWGAPPTEREIRLSVPVNKKVLLKWYSGNKEKAQEANRHLTHSFWSGYATVGKKDFIRVPADQYNVALAELDLMSKNKSRLISSARESEGQQNIHFIGQGETLSDISQQFGVSVRMLIEINGIENPRRLMPGQKLVIPK